MIRYASLLILGVSLVLQVEAHVELINPEGGETFRPGEIVNVEWVQVVAHNTLDWDLFYSTDGGSNWIVLKSDIPLETLNYQWTVPDLPTGQAKIKVIQDNELDDYESVSPNFSIAYASAVDEASHLIQVKMYPNPMLDYTIIDFENPTHNPLSLSILNDRGGTERLIPHISSGSIKLYRQDLSPGMYFIMLKEDNEIRVLEKLVLYSPR